MNMHERIINGKLFTDMCEGMPAERLKAKQLQKEFNDLAPDQSGRRGELLNEIFGSNGGCWVEPPLYFCYGKHINVGEGTYKTSTATL